ncbi:hypothetical protein CLAIMM_07493 [Cladophialophora immunda]|nr:hypothetical protein CLAIMM_07493 [Cladophialophora immunda]
MRSSLISEKSARERGPFLTPSPINVTSLLLLCEDQKVLIWAISEKTTHKIEESHETTRREVQQAIAKSAASTQYEHDQTRQEIRSEGKQAEIRSQESYNATAKRIESTELEIISSIEAAGDANQVEHANTQREIAKLKGALQALSEQIESRNQELKSLLSAFNLSKSKKKREQFSEWSNAVTAALLALETMYRSLKEVLSSLQARAKELLDKTQTSGFSTIIRYAHRVSDSPTSHDSRLSIDLIQRRTDVGDADADPTALHKSAAIWTGHDMYFGCFYRCAIQQQRLVNSDDMNRRWKFQNQLRIDQASSSNFEGFVVDERPCSSSWLWLFASVTLALEAHLSPEGKEFELLSTTLDQFQRFRPKNTYSRGSFSGRLKADMRYWSAFATMRGMKQSISGGQIHLESLNVRQKDDLYNLIRLLVGEWPEVRARDRPVPVSVEQDGPATTIARSLSNMGLPVSLIDQQEKAQSLPLVTIQFGGPTIY